MPANTPPRPAARPPASAGPARRAVSVVIPVKNETQSLPALIASLHAQTCAPAEIIIVDGGSTDGTVALARALAATDEKIRVIETAEATPGRGRNLGIAAARHEWIALVDAGVHVEATWLAQLLAALERAPGAEVVYGNYEPVTDTRFTRAAAVAYVPPKWQSKTGWLRGPSTASMLLQRAVWQRVGGFPDLRAAEDLIFMERIAQQGCYVTHAPQATVWWQLQPTFAATFRRFANYSRHNVWAGRQRGWHYGLLRQYVVAAGFVLLALVHSPWWLLALPLGMSARTAKSVWQHRAGHGLAWGLNPLQFGYVLLILLTLDLATYVGWIQAGAHPARRPATAPAHTSETEPPA
ncbi:MAG: glycosyltransferase [Pyrinomonadaceae bacterium]